MVREEAGLRLYMITNRRLFGGPAEQASQAFWESLARWVPAGLDFVQIREKDMHCADLEQMAHLVQETLLKPARTHGMPPPPVLINASSEQQVKVACKAASGVHLPGDTRTLTARVREARAIWRSGRPSGPAPLVSVSCHTAGEVEEARAAEVSVILFAPVFEKPLWDEPPLGQRRPGVLPPPSVKVRPEMFPPSRLKATLPGVGLAALQAACAAAGPVPVFALGGVTLQNAGECVAAGAAGIAGIRLFAEEAWRERTER